MQVMFKQVPKIELDEKSETKFYYQNYKSRAEAQSLIGWFGGQCSESSFFTQTMSVFQVKQCHNKKDPLILLSDSPAAPWGKNGIVLGSPLTPKPPQRETTVSGNLQYVLQVSSSNEGTMLRTSPSTT